jgi:hypothetical protein
LRWNTGSLQILNQKNINLTFKAAIPPALNTGDTLKLSASITHSNTDVTPSNNQKNIQHVVIGSFDPNDKLEIHNDVLHYDHYLNGDYLNYLVNFQNVGNDTAFYVEIRDTLDSKVN